MDSTTRTNIMSVYTRLLEAWNRRNAEDFAAVFADHASVVGFDGSQMNGRAEIATTLGQIFKDHPTAAYVAKIREARQLAPGVVLLRSVVGMVPPGKNEIKPDVNAVQSLVFVDIKGEWTIALLHNTPAAFHGRPEAAQQLTAELTGVLESAKTVDAST
jgi:uncharacterized protein (TIGR02246 family)